MKYRFFSIIIWFFWGGLGLFMVNCSNHQRENIYATSPDGFYCEYNGNRYSKTQSGIHYDRFCERFDHPVERNKCYADRMNINYYRSFHNCNYTNDLLRRYPNHLYPYSRNVKCREKHFLGGIGVARFCINTGFRAHLSTHAPGSNRGARCSLDRYHQPDCHCVPLYHVDPLAPVLDVNHFSQVQGICL